MTAATLDRRFTDPLLTIGETARHLQIGDDTVRRWIAEGGLVHAAGETLERFGRHRRMPLIAVAETQTLRAFREAGVTLTTIRAAVGSVRKTLGPYGLATERFALLGRDLLVDVARKTEPDWARAQDLQTVLPRVFEDHMQYLEFEDGDDYPQRVRLRSYGLWGADVILEPGFGFGEPVFRRNRVRTRDVTDAFFAGESPEDIAYDYDLTLPEVYAAIRVLGHHLA